MRLLDLPEAIAEHVVDGDLSAGHARALLALDDPKTQAAAAETVIAEVDELCDEPLNPAEITIPGIFIDYIVKSNED